MRNDDKNLQDHLRSIREQEIKPPHGEQLWNKVAQQLEMGQAFGLVLSEAHVKPPTHVWRNINAALNAKQKRRPVAFWYTTAAALLLLVALGGWFGQTIISPQPQTPFLNTETAPKKEQHTSPQQPEASITETDQQNKQTSKTESTNAQRPIGGNKTAEEKIVLEEETTGDGAVVDIVRLDAPALLQPLAYQNIGAAGEVLRLVALPQSQVANESATGHQPRWWVGVLGGTGVFVPAYAGSFAERSIAVRPADGDDLRQALTGRVRGTTTEYALAVGYALHNRWHLQTGLRYVQTQYSIETNFHRSFRPDLQSNNIQRFDYVDHLTHTQSWISVPVLMGYQASQGRIQTLIQAGISTDWNLRDTHKSAETHAGYSYTLGERRGMSANALVGLQLRYALLPNQRLGIIVDGLYERALSSQLLASDVSQHPERYQLRLGVAWGF